MPMPFLDVTDVLLDPYFVDTTLVCVRNSQNVGNDGLAVDTPTSIPFIGVITSDQGDVLKRLGEGSFVEGSIIIESQFVLRSGGGTATDADIVQWSGRTYTVKSVNDYSHYGRGFVSAVCTLIPLGG